MSISEFGLIQQISKSIHDGPSVILGIGDDTAVVKVDSKKDILFATDMLIEDRHFRLADATPYEIGWKALAVNLSDIAAMGGTPTHAVVALGLPKNFTVGFVKGIYRGMTALAKRFNVAVVGGDTNRSDKLVVSVALLGEVSEGRAVRRSGAKAGDIICVSGPLGGSYRSKKHLRFVPRVDEARFLAEHFQINAMMDISDGLSSDLHRLTEAGGVGAVVEEKCIPLTKHAKSVREALSDGEDFELLYTLQLKEAERLLKSGFNRKHRIFCPIGWVVQKSRGVRIVKNGVSKPLVEMGYDHFKT